MKRFRLLILPALFVILHIGACTSTEPYARDNTGYRYVVVDSPERALAELKRWATPKTITSFETPNTPHGHKVKTARVEVGQYEITLTGERWREYTDVRYLPGSESMTIPYSSIIRVEKDIPLLVFFGYIITDKGKYTLTFWDGTSMNRFVDTLLMYLPHGQ